mgnify:CR=1 FL=1
MWVTSWVKRERHSILEWRVSGPRQPGPRVPRSKLSAVKLWWAACYSVELCTGLPQSSLHHEHYCWTLKLISNAVNAFRLVTARPPKSLGYSRGSAMNTTLNHTTLNSLQFHVLARESFCLRECLRWLYSNRSSEWDMGIHSHLERICGHVRMPRPPPR